MLVDSSPQLNQNKHHKPRSNRFSSDVRIIQHLTGALLLLIIINIGLVSWIIQSTQLLHVSILFALPQIKVISHNYYFFKDPLGRSSLSNTIRVEGRLVTDQVLQTDKIIAPNTNIREPRLGPFLTITSNIFFACSLFSSSCGKKNIPTP